MTPEQSSCATADVGVSVVIPAYNYARYLPRAIDSALAQEHPKLEIIVVDDGSTDDTAEIIRAYGERVRYIYQQNAGLPAARNTGIKAARFDYIGFLDADDEWQPQFLRCALDTFDHLPPSFAIVASRVQYIGPTGEALTFKQLDESLAGEIRCRDIILKTRFSPSAVVARKIAFETCGLFDVTLRSSEDRDMWIRIAARYRVQLLRERWVRIRRHPNNMSKHADRMKANVRNVIAKSYRNHLVPHADFCFWLRVFSIYFFQNAWRFRDEGRRCLAVRELLFSLLLWPCFARPDFLNEPPLFRLRSLLRFSRECLAS